MPGLDGDVHQLDGQTKRGWRSIWTRARQVTGATCGGREVAVAAVSVEESAVAAKPQQDSVASDGEEAG